MDEELQVILAELRDHLKSDYDIITESADADAADQINYAQEFLDMAEQLMGPPPTS